MSIDCLFKTLTAPGSNEILQSHNSLTFKLLKTVADFSQALASLHDKFGHELQMLVETFRKRNGELRKERLHCPNSLFQIWELFLQQVEVNSQQHGDISRNFSQTIGNGLIERVFHRKIQSKKIFAHRDRIETILLKSNELLLKCYRDYCQAYALALTNPAQYMSEYIASHNVYVHQLQATNGMIHAYQTKALPRLLEELEECHLETSLSISSSLLESSELVQEKSNEQASGYQMIATACKQANHRQDLAQFVKVTAAHVQSQQQQSTNSSSAGNELSSPNSNGQTSGSSGLGVNVNSLLADGHDSGGLSSSVGGGDKSVSIRYHQFQSPNLQNTELSQIEPKNMQIVPTFKNEIAPDLSQPPTQQQPQLEKDRESLEEKIEKFEERIESLNKLLVRSSESRLTNKVNELQEELCQKRFDLYVAQIHLSAVRSQLQLFEYNYRPTNLATFSQSTLSLLAHGKVGQDAPQPGDLSGVPGLAVGGGGSSSGGSSSLSRKTSSGLGGGGHHQAVGYRNKWIKAFKSLKETPSTPSGASSGQQKFADDPLRQDILALQQNQLQQQSNQQQENQHFFQEYTFKKIASCDVCKDFLRGHMRQGVKCKLCKISCHNDCQSKAHATIKCQQPKIKLLRRQKSAGELEVNNSDADNVDPSERTLSSSKPDSIYQLIRQVLDAKKKGQSGAAAAAAMASQQQQQQQASLFVHQQDSEYHLRVNSGQRYGALANSALMNLSTGNLALANQNGKSVSTSALGTTTAASVDRWAVVMDLLAQSRKQDKENSLGDHDKVDSSGKRHSKQLDKFKLAAKSAAAASKHQRHYQQQQQQQQRQPPSPTNLHQDQQSSDGTQSPTQHRYSQGSMQQQQQGPNSSPVGHHQYHQQAMQQQHHLVPGDVSASGGGYIGQISHQGIVAPSSGEQQQQQMHLHHTKSLPVGQLAPANQQQQQMQSGNNLTVGSAVNHSGQPVGAMMGPMGDGGGGIMQPVPGGSMQHQVAAQQQMPYQLLNIGSQQLQSTSAPHSPQRKRFNLRMKSFSLDSPESPSVMGVTPPTTSVAYHTPNHATNHHSSQVYSSGGNLVQGDQMSAGSHQIHLQQQQHQHYERSVVHHQQTTTTSSAVGGATNPLYLNQQQQQLYMSQQTGGGGGYQQQQQQQQQQTTYIQYHQQQYIDPADSGGGGQHLSAANGMRSGRHSSAGGQLYQHRHSYNIPSFHYQQQADGHLTASTGQHSSSQNALNSSVQLADLEQHPTGSQIQPMDKQHRGSGSSGVGIGGLSDNKQHGGSNDNVSVGCDGPNARNDYYDLNLDVGLRSSQQQQQQQQQQSSSSSSSPLGTFVVLYDYVAQRSDEIQLNAGRLVAVLDTSERDWWNVRVLDGSNRVGYFPSSYLAKLYKNERPLQVAQTIQVSNGETCDKLLRGQIVIHTGKQMDSFVNIRTVTGDSSNHCIQCPEKYLMEVVETS